MENGSHTAFGESIDLEQVREVCTVMDEYMHNNDNGSLNAYNLVERCNGILYNAAESSGNIINLVDRSNIECVARKPWFNNGCKMFQNEHHRSKNYNRRQRTAESKLNMVIASRAIRKLLVSSLKSYQDNVVKNCGTYIPQTPRLIGILLIEVVILRKF